MKHGMENTGEEEEIDENLKCNIHLTQILLKTPHFAIDVKISEVHSIALFDAQKYCNFESFLKRG